MQWPEFTFFDVTPIRDPEAPESLLYSDPDVLTVVPSHRDTAFLTTRRGRVTEFDEQLQVRTSWMATSDPEASLDFVLPVKSAPHFIGTVTTRQNESTVIQVWNLDDIASDKPDPRPHSEIIVHNATNTYPLTCIVAADDLSVLALGYTDGNVVVVRGDILHDRGARQRLMYTASSAVTGLSLIDGGDALFVTSLDQIACISTSASSTRPTLLEKTRGAQYGCTTRIGDDIIVARDTEITWYSRSHRGLSFEDRFGTKSRINTFKQGAYLVLVVVFESQSVLSTESVRLVILDTVNSLVAFSSHLAPGIRMVFEQWGRLNVLGTDGILYTLKERDIQARIATLTAQQLYQIAIKMTENYGDQILLGKLHNEYADNLYSRNDIDAALDHYIAAIDLNDGEQLPTSHAIIRYKESHRAPHLRRYLEAVWEHGKATPKHMTLLVTCLAKLREEEALTTFLSKAVEVPGFDFSQAVDVLLVARFFELAAYVAKQWPDPDLVAEIKLRDMHDYAGCLDYIYTVPAADALRILIQNTRQLLQVLPVETMGVLITLFTGKFVTRATKDETTNGSAKGHNDVVTGSEKPDTVSETASAPVLQSYQAFINYISSASFLGSRLVNAATLEAHETALSYQPPRPRLIFPAFVGHENEFVVFLEACLRSAPDFQPSAKDLSDIATTLYEVYLMLASTEPNGSWESKAKNLIDEHGEILDKSTVRTVSVVYGVTLETPHLVALGWNLADILCDRVEKGDIEGALAIFDEHSDNIDVAMAAIHQFTSSADLLDHIRKTRGLQDILTKCIRAGLTPVQLIQEVSTSRQVTVEDLRPFISEYMRTTQAEIERHNVLADSYAAEAAEKRRKTEDLNGDTPFIVQYGQCALCGLPLNLPAVHFACQHSYHKRCLADSTVCRQCLPENENIASIQQSNAATAARQDLFFEELAARPGLRTITDFISRGGLSLTDHE